MQPADFAVFLIIIGALILGIALGRAYQHRKDIAMANSADALKQAVAEHLADSKAKDDQITALNAELATTKADLAADEQAIADSVAQLKPQPAPEAQPAA